MTTRGSPLWPEEMFPSMPLCGRAPEPGDQFPDGLLKVWTWEWQSKGAGEFRGGSGNQSAGSSQLQEGAQVMVRTLRSHSLVRPGEILSIKGSQTPVK